MATLDDAHQVRALDDDRESAVPKMRDDLRRALEQIQSSLDLAAATVETDASAALDDILAARLVVGTLLLRLDGAGLQAGDAQT